MVQKPFMNRILNNNNNKKKTVCGPAMTLVGAPHVTFRYFQTCHYLHTATCFKDNSLTMHVHVFWRHTLAMGSTKFIMAIEVNWPALNGFIIIKCFFSINLSSLMTQCCFFFLISFKIEIIIKMKKTKKVYNLNLKNDHTLTNASNFCYLHLIWKYSNIIWMIDEIIVLCHKFYIFMKKVQNVKKTMNRSRKTRIWCIHHNIIYSSFKFIKGF